MTVPQKKHSRECNATTPSGNKKKLALEILHNLQNQSLRTNATNTTNPNKQTPTKSNEQTTNKPNATKNNTTEKTDKDKSNEPTITTKTRDKRLLSDESTGQRQSNSVDSTK